jgi:hypothetical protein
VKKQTAEDGRKGKTMKLEGINNRTNEVFSYLVAALESGQSEVLTEYLNAMARFHTYSFGNIMLIARQKPAATRVAGIRTWNSLGRFVKRGEKARADCQGPPKSFDIAQDTQFCGVDCGLENL